MLSLLTMIHFSKSLVIFLNGISSICRKVYLSQLQLSKITSLHQLCSSTIKFKHQKSSYLHQLNHIIFTTWEIYQRYSRVFLKRLTNLLAIKMILLNFGLTNAQELSKTGSLVHKINNFSKVCWRISWKTISKETGKVS